MLRLPHFQVSAPTTVEEVVAALKEKPGARLIAGGTDLLPNLKHRLEAPEQLISLGRLTSLRGIVRDEAAGVLRIGSQVRLAEIAADPQVAALFPSLATSAGLVASPSIRNTATIGGNVNLDVRCRYVNQSDFWRGGIGGGCLKSEGDVCHVVPKGRNCVAAMSSDNVPVLISLGASLVLVGPEGAREVAMADYYRADGLRHTKAEDGELTTEVRIPLPTAPRRVDYVKWAVRKSIDFPLVSIALRFDLDGEGADAAITAVQVVVGVLGAKPRQVSRLDAVIGRAMNDPEVALLVSEATFKQCKPLPNVPYEPAYRRQMIRVYTRRAIQALAQG